MQIPDLLFYRANKYVIITFGALQRKCKHTPLNTLSLVCGTHPRVLEGAPCHVTDTTDTPTPVQCLLRTGGRESQDWAWTLQWKGEKQVKRAKGPLPSLLWSLLQGRVVGWATITIRPSYRTPTACPANSISFQCYQVGLCVSSPVLRS